MSIVFSVCSAAASAAAVVQDLVDQVSQSQYTTYQVSIQDMGLGLYGGPAYNQGYRNRFNTDGPAFESLGFKEANLYLINTFSAMSPRLSVTVQSDYKNVIAELPGTDPDPAIRDRVFIVGGHYDHPQFDGDAPGGDDNASGTAGVLEAARVLSQYQFRSTIRFIAWGGEEGWMLGSWDYVRNVVKPNADPTHQDIAGVLNLDMILRPGWDGDPNAVIDLDLSTRPDYASCRAWADRFRAAAAAYTPALPIDPVTHDDWYPSDQGPFMSAAQGFLYPALMVAENTANEIWSGQANWYYHKSGDASDRAANNPTGGSGVTYNYAFATNVVRASVGLIAEEALMAAEASTHTLRIEFLKNVNGTWEYGRQPLVLNYVANGTVDHPGDVPLDWPHRFADTAPGEHGLYSIDVPFGDSLSTTYSLSADEAERVLIEAYANALDFASGKLELTVLSGDKDFFDAFQLRQREPGTFAEDEGSAPLTLGDLLDDDGHGFVDFAQWTTSVFAGMDYRFEIGPRAGFELVPPGGSWYTVDPDQPFVVDEGSLVVMTPHTGPQRAPTAGRSPFAVPEPPVFGLLCLGSIGLVAHVWRRRRASTGISCWPTEVRLSMDDRDVEEASGHPDVLLFCSDERSRAAVPAEASLSSFMVAPVAIPSRQPINRILAYAWPP